MATRWEELQPVSHRTPCPEVIVRAMVGLALAFGWRRWAGVTLAIFYCIARPGELLTAKRSQILTPLDILDSEHPWLYVRILRPKSRRKAARVQHAKLKDPEALLLLTALWQKLRKTELLYPGSPSIYKRRWDRLLALLQVPKELKLTPGSLRSGGAVSAFQKGETVSELLWRMRLRSLATLEFYLQETAAISVLPDLPEHTRRRLLAAASIYRNVVAELRGKSVQNPGSLFADPAALPFSLSIERRGTDRDRLQDAREELWQMLKDPELGQAPSESRQQDLPDALPPDEVAEKLGLSELRGRQWFVQPTSATKGSNTVIIVIGDIYYSSVSARSARPTCGSFVQMDGRQLNAVKGDTFGKTRTNGSLERSCSGKPEFAMQEAFWNDRHHVLHGAANTEFHESDKEYFSVFLAPRSKRVVPKRQNGWTRHLFAHKQRGNPDGMDDPDMPCELLHRSDVRIAVPCVPGSLLRELTSHI
ncbi:ARF6 [Symbiodinium microadriaticum]|nr:ARF6 [Symbiodinium microadriaticum]